VADRALPAGVPVLVPIPLLQRDPAAYDEPDRLEPGRFVDAEPALPHYMPFGGGARACIGQALFETYLDTLVPAILRRVRLRPVLPREERAVLRATILVPRRATPVIAQPRSSA
jgi:cytochrome P450